MTDKSSATVPIIVAVIGVVGTITTALIANWDKIMGGRSADPPAAQQSVQAAGSATETRPASAAPDLARPVDVAGTWVSADAHSFLFDQNGTSYSFRQIKDGVQVGSGGGTLDGRRFRHNFTSVYGNGSCAGEVSADGSSSSGTCTDGTNSWGMQVFRSASAKS